MAKGPRYHETRPIFFLKSLKSVLSASAVSSKDTPKEQANKRTRVHQGGNGDNLVNLVSKKERVTADLRGNLALLRPKRNFVGLRYRCV
jgi:hypothetical protein